MPREVTEIDRFIGQRVRHYRKALGISIEDLAKQLGMSYQQVHKYEVGSNRISGGTLFEIAEIVKTPIQHFFPDSEHGNLSIENRLHMAANEIGESLKMMKAAG